MSTEPTTGEPQTQARAKGKMREIRSVSEKKVAGWFNAAATPPEDRYASSFGIFLGGLAFIALGVVLFTALINLWPLVERTAHATPTLQRHRVWLVLGLYRPNIDQSTGLLLLALLMGAIGGYVHATTSFVSYIGNRQFKASWGWWYILRAFIGAALALLTYLALRGGFLTGESSTAGTINAYGVATISGLVGLFSKQATDKLEEIFNTAFRTSSTIGDSQRSDSMAPSPEVPIVTALDPHTVFLRPTDPVKTVKIKGAGFHKYASVKLNGVALPAPQWQSASEISFNLPGSIMAPGTVRVVVVNPNEASSAPRELRVEQ
jgi:hypothetical protein